MKTTKKGVVSRILCLLLSLSLLVGLGSAAIPVAAAPLPKVDNFTYFLYDLADFVVKPLIRAISMLFPSVDVPRCYESENFLPGMDTFLDTPAAGAKWSLGYASASLLAGQNVLDGKHYLGGGLAALERRNPEAILDDQRVRVTALNDGSGRGTVVFAAIDGFGVTSADVRTIREMLISFAKEKKIVSINVSALHQHSVIDTLGMNGFLPEALFLNPIANLTGLFAPFSGKNPEFMENLHNVVADSVKKAVNGMEPGTLRYGKVNIREYINTKRPPYVLDPNLHRFRFDPDNASSKETWLINLAIHCVGYGSGGDGRELTGDYPYYMEQVINKAGANFQLIQGAQMAISLDTTPVRDENKNGFENMQAYGRALGKKAVDITGETTVAPLLNIAHKEYSIPIDNPLHMLFFRLGMITSTASKSGCFGLGMNLWTEVGYMEIGNDLAVTIVPSEIDPALAFGGGLKAADAWTSKDWAFTPMQDTVGTSRKLIVFGLTNDQAGYTIMPNDIHQFILFQNEEINAASKEAAPNLLKAFADLVKSK